MIKGSDYMGAGGRPLTYKTAKELEDKIEEYFKACEGTMLKDKKGKIILDKYLRPIYIGYKPCTVTGLALFLGFKSRQALLNYQGKQEFNDTITRAKLRIEEFAETRLYDKDGCNGAKFNLANNFGWKERQEIESTNDSTVHIKLEGDLKEWAK